MYEDITYEQILKRMLDRVPNDLDKREGSVIYTALAPAAAEMQNMYIELDWMLNQSFADTQDREYLIRRCAERGIIPELATNAILKGEFSKDIPIGSRFSLGLLNYTVIEKIDSGLYQLKCEVAGSDGNRSLGDLFPIDYIEGLASAKLTGVLVPGEDEESTEHLRQRYFNSLNAKAFGGNIQDYVEKTNSLNGVGGTKVYPTWDGGGTVKLVLIDSSSNKPSTELLTMVKEVADPEDCTGQGVGFAPIGHVVTVGAVSEVVIDIATNVTLNNGWEWQDVIEHIELCVEEYLKELRASWAESDGLIVRTSQIELRILNLAGILDIADTKINGIEGNLSLGPDEIPVRGTVVNGAIFD